MTTIYYVTAISQKPESKSWAWLWYGQKLVPETRSPEEVERAASAKGFEIYYCDIILHGVPPGAAAAIRRAAAMMMIRGGAIITNDRLDATVEVSLRMVER